MSAQVPCPSRPRSGTATRTPAAGSEPPSTTSADSPFATSGNSRSAENPGVRKVSWSLSPVSSSVPDARHLVRGQLAAWGADRQSEIVELLTSELVTNTLRHAWGPILLVLSFQDGTLRCEVEDANPALPGLRNARDDEEEAAGCSCSTCCPSAGGATTRPRGRPPGSSCPYTRRPTPHDGPGHG
ncbi:ATP-binding protein [Streptosporangium lutulentum]